MSRQYFGTDGVRGRVGQSPIVPEFGLRLGHAAGRVLRKQGVDRPAVLIGKDTRVSGYMLEAALECGFSAAGCDVVLVGPLPTPGVAYLTRALRLDLGVVISASHNPYADNGIKFFSAAGSKLPDAWEAEVEAELPHAEGCVPSEQLGKARRLDDAAGRYIEFCKSTFPSHLTLKGLRLVVDCAHGAAYHIAPSVFHELGAEVVSIGVQPDGFNINKDVGATAPDALIRAVRANHADYGVALDGDADRLQLVDGQGRLFNGDELLYLLAMDRRPAGVVGTLMTNLAVEQALQAQGMDFVRAAVGDRYVLEELLARGWQLGGEGSGHILLLDRHTTGDGIVAALQMLELVVRTGRTLGEQLHSVRLYPQTLLNVRLPDGLDWKTHAGFARARAQVEGSINGSGRVLIRPSGTEPVLRIMVEHADPLIGNQSAQMLADALR
ncbi:MAG: phosphoglucosamine mutase [Thiomonas sp. 15-66-11]|jgi:phosphoglucosamine mutase|uniref:Phosphoglucosamine mutase n=1 Tax=Thiomonas delicata TaxID=364030 RepID=A0A238D6L4_THIDL|nr:MULTISPECIES: phosphoglucosamine mutase [Thiomonas]OZB44401.1 MAG: phosphoglucosamine mutase [Thiomonas sp. 15-66-11]SBP88861.1 phosphoglucosamine mutase [Thiomonas delicata]